MKIGGKHYRSVWVEPDGWSAGIIDQTKLPHEFALLRLSTAEDCARAIKTMQTRGAPLIGPVAAHGLCLALRADASGEALHRAHALLPAPPPSRITFALAPGAVSESW